MWYLYALLCKIVLNTYLNQFDGGHLGFDRHLEFKNFHKNCFASSVFDSTLVLHVQLGNKHA